MAELFNDLVHNPIITIFTLGFYIKDLFVGWGLGSLGWVLCIVIEVIIGVLTLSFASWFYLKVKSIIKSFKKE